MNGVYPVQGRIFRPWKNGGGETAEIVASPAGADFADFDWRISTAIVAQSADFSIFPGVDRILTVIEGGAMRLDIAGATHLMDAGHPPLAFAGDVACHAVLTDGALLDFNVMVRRPLQAQVDAGPLVLPVSGSAACFALLLEPAAGLARLDLLELDAADGDLVTTLVGVSALRVTITR